MGDSFQTLRGSLIREIRDSILRVCSFWPTSSQYLSRMIPESTITLSTNGASRKNRDSS